ncbi:hypothetical protein RI054_02g07440 [Pseudoscourfieldia marina]
MVSRGLFFAALLAMCGTAQAVIRVKTGDQSAGDLRGLIANHVQPANIPSSLNANGAATDLLPETLGIDQGFYDTLGTTRKVRISSNTLKLFVTPYDDDGVSAPAACGANVGCVNDATYDSTVTLYYTINGGATVTIGTYTRTQLLASTPFIFLDNMADGSYTFATWAVQNAKSNTKATNTEAIGTVPTTAIATTINNNDVPIKTDLTIIVDTTMPVTTITTAMSAYSNAATGTITYTCSKAADATTSGGEIEFLVSFAGSAYVAQTPRVTANGANSGTYTYNLAGQTDGSYTFSVYCKWYGSTTSDAGPNAAPYNVDATIRAGYVETTNPKPSLTWFYDTTAPVVAVQAGPGVGGAASLFAYGAGTTSFTFSCTDENGLACTYKCALDGKATSNGASTSTASKGYYSCTSGHTITLAAGETTTFHVYAVDLAGNESPLSPMYAYSNDNTAPLVAFTNMDGDGAAVLNTATQTSNAVESFGGYYPTTFGAANEYLKDGTTALYTRNIGATTGGLNPLDDLDVATAATTTNGVTTSEATYRTVLQVAMDTTDPVYDLTSNGSRGVTDGYGVLLAAREVNGVTPTGVTAYGAYYYNVLLSTNSPGGKFTFTCIHDEMKNGDLVGTIVTA